MFNEIVGGIGAGVSIANSLLSGYNAYKNNQIQKESLDKTYQMNSENIALQRETNQANLDYARELNSLTMSREDNAHQREVADLRAAGLSPFATMNGAGAGDFTVPNLSAPQNDIGAISSQLGNIGTSYGMAQSSLQNASINAMNMLSFIQSEEKIKNEKDVNDSKVALAEKQYVLDKTIKYAELDIEKERLHISSDINYEELKLKQHLDEREEQALISALRLSASEYALNQAKQAQTQIETLIAENEEERNKHLYDQEMRMKDIEYSRMVHDFDNAIIRDAIQNDILKWNSRTSQFEVEHMMDRLKLDKKSVRWQSFRDAMIGISAGINSVSNVAKAVASFVPGGNGIVDLQ